MIDSARIIVGAILAAIVLAGVLAGVRKISDWHTAYERVPALEQAVKDADATLTRERLSAARAQKVSNAYQTDLAAARAERDRLRNLPPRVVRVLVPAAAPRVQRPGSAGRPLAAGPGPVELTGEAGSGPRLSRNIGPDIFGIADDSDEREAVLAAQVTRLQQAYAVAAQGCSGVIP